MTTNEPEGQKLTCTDCGHTFIFTPGEQSFFYDRKLKPPKRCKECRQARKLEQGKDPIKDIKRIPS